MEKLRLLGALCICVIALVSASANSNNPLVSNLLNTVFMISCGVIGLWLLRKTNLSDSLRVVRKRASRRFDLPVEFPLEDNLGVFVINDRRQLPDRRKAKYVLDDMKGIHTKIASN